MKKVTLWASPRVRTTAGIRKQSLVLDKAPPTTRLSEAEIATTIQVIRDDHLLLRDEGPRTSEN